MHSRYQTRGIERAHFVTSTVVDWLPLLQSSTCCDILVQSLEYCRRDKGLKLYAWVIMENHFPLSFPKLAKRFGNASSVETPFPDRHSPAKRSRFTRDR